jgi:hypothetical protein
MESVIYYKCTRIFTVMPYECREGIWESGGMAPLFFTLDARWRMISFAPGPFYLQEKNPQYPLNRRLGGPQSRSGRFGETKT